MMEIQISQGTTEVHVISITPEIANELTQFEQDPSSFNRMDWPIGASAHGHGMFLVHVDEMSKVDPQASVALRMGEASANFITFDKLYITQVRPVFISEGSRSVYAVELADERYLWQFDGCDARLFNVHTADKGILYDDSERNPNEPWQPIDAVLEIIQSLSTDPDEWDTNILDVPIFNDLSIRDVISDCLNAAQMLDKIIMACGCVLLAGPEDGYANLAPNKRYKVVSIGSGLASLSTNLEIFNHDLSGGGVLPVPATFVPPSGGAGQFVAPSSEFLQNEVPSQLSIAFPIAIDGGSGYKFGENETNVNWVTQRFFRVITSNSRPVDPGNGQTQCVFGVVWAIMDSEGNVQNEDDLNTRADFLAFVYYQRFSSGACDLWFVDLLRLDLFSGGQMITWHIDAPSSRVYTRVKGDYHCPLFGSIHTGVLTPQDVFTTGGIRAVPRPDGGILLDSVPAQIERQWPGRIVGAVSIGTDRWKYLVVRQRSIQEFEEDHPIYVDVLDEAGLPVMVDAYNRAEEWHTTHKFGLRRAYGVQMDEDPNDEFCIRLIPIGASQMGQPVSTPSVVVWITEESTEIEADEGKESTFETRYWFSSGNDVDVECCPCDSFPPEACPT